MGYNAVYCKPSCKSRFKAAPNPILKKAGAKRSYQRIMLDPDRREVRRYNANPCALQFDHEGPKTASISSIRSSQRRILTEIESGKCVLRCANCHAVKTWADKNGITYVPGMAQDEEIWNKFWQEKCE